MATPARGLGRERHTGIKAAAAATAVGGFVAAWLGFVNSHGAATTDSGSEVLALASTLESTSIATAIATATSSVPPSNNEGAASATPTATGEPAAEPTASPMAAATTIPQSRMSRGS